MATDAAKHAAHSLEEVGKGKNTERAAVFEVVEDAVADFGDEGEIVAIARGGGAAQGFIDPCGIVADHRLVGNFESGKSMREADHGRGYLKSLRCIGSCRERRSRAWISRMNSPTSSNWR